MITLTQYLLAALVAYLGLLAGLIVSLLSKEELKPGRKYFFLLQNCIFVSLCVIFLYVNKVHWLANILVSTLVVIALYFARTPLSSAITYPIMGLMFFLSSKNSNAFSLVSSMIFLYGIPTASLQIKKSYFRPFIVNAGFIAVVLVSLLF
jgi:hypothetical protein